MTVSTCRNNFLVYNEDLHKFLSAIQEKCLKTNSTRIVSISLDIDLVDPLVVFEKLAQIDGLNFYWENKSKGEVIAGIGSAAKFETSGKQRFTEVEEFTKFCLENTTTYGKTNPSFAKPHFFYSFGFFDENTQLNYPFPAASVFLPRWQIVAKNERSVLVANVIINGCINIKRLLQVLSDKVEVIYSLEYYPRNINYARDKLSKKNVINTDKFKQSVASVLEKISTQQLTKVVLADILDVTSSHNFNLCQSLDNLRQLHPNCCTFLASNGKGQNFIGASPERLISIHKQQLITDALAGSAPRGKTPEEDAANANRLLRSQKERHEHALVTEFITQRLSQIGLLPQVLAPRLRQLSNIQHLWTPINANVPPNIHPLQIVAQLHPTPAVAGAATEIACNEIRCYESFERGLYAAPLGWIDSEGNCEFIVGIRSALIDGKRARLYAGAGIVAGSDPDKELAEVQLKLQALLKALV
jgi:menaquinone-specific isochorismate synthase